MLLLYCREPTHVGLRTAARSHAPSTGSGRPERVRVTFNHGGPGGHGGRILWSCRDCPSASSASSVVVPGVALPREPERQLRLTRQAALRGDAAEARIANARLRTAGEPQLVERVQHLDAQLP